ncbi:1,4-dihydroxy-2-naphthoyl-CoA synthase [Brachybacterium timonense]|uniref:1,4-dihydroxy-2-naphthoyl-CoA synthase n=1 Tax=Brachybacterium timonense TaxID=2050896 RepID=UPI000D0BDE18
MSSAVHLRAVTVDDAPAVLDVFSSHPDMERQGRVTTLAEAQALTARLCGDGQRAVAICNATDHLLGVVALTIDAENRNAWFFYWLHAAHRGRGLTSRAAATVAATVEPMTSSAPLPRQVSDTFDPSRWRDIDERELGGAAFTDITYHRAVERDDAGAIVRDLPCVRIAFDRPEVRNAFRPHTVDELYRALDHARLDTGVGVILLTGNGPSPKDGGHSFCSGGDQRIRGRSGYEYAEEEDSATARAGSAGRLHILEVQRLMRTMGKVTIALVNGWAAGGGHSLHVVADLSIASREHARFKQTDANVGSFDGGYGSAYLAKQVGQKRAREIFFLAEEYSAQDAYDWGAVNRVVDHAEIENEGLRMASVIATKSPQAIRMLKFAFNLADDGLMGQQVFAGEATRLAYMTDEAVEGRDAFLGKRAPDWSRFPHPQG